jgi:LmeA-like phospholipid-binding
VVLTLVLLVLLAPASLVDPLMRRSVARYGGECTDLVGVDVDSGVWPTVARMLTGQLHDVSLHVDEMRSEGFTYYDVSFSAAEVEFAPLGGLVSDRATRVHDGETSATVRFDDIEQLIARSGTTVQLRQQGTTLVADVEVPFVGPLPTTVGISPVDGDMELLFAPLDVFTLPPVRVPIPAPLSLRQVEVRSDALRFDSTVDGVVPADDLGCDVDS